MVDLQNTNWKRWSLKFTNNFKATVFFFIWHFVEYFETAPTVANTVSTLPLHPRIYLLLMNT